MSASLPGENATRAPGFCRWLRHRRPAIVLRAHDIKGRTSDVSPTGSPAGVRLSCTWHVDADLSARCLRGDAAGPCANRLRCSSGAHREPKSQPRVRQSAGTGRCRKAARRDRAIPCSLSRGLPRKASRHESLLRMLSHTRPLGVEVPAQLQTTLAAHPQSGDLGTAPTAAQLLFRLSR